jgi:aspartate--ammonia ligase
MPEQAGAGGLYHASADHGGIGMAKGLQLPTDYKNLLTLRQTEEAIKYVKDEFELGLAHALNLTRVSAPLFVVPDTGLNDNLNGVERPVSFDVPDLNHQEAEIVHSLAKWKRHALARYGFTPGEGIYTDMNAIRRDEQMDNLHSIYVDQWDWEKVITRDTRNETTLKMVVRSIYDVFKRVEFKVIARYPMLKAYLPEEIVFVTTQELEDRWPELSRKQREDRIAREHGAVFLRNIGGKLASGEIHDGRAPDYDDWSLNGDIVFWYPLLEQSFEVSSMGIRVDAASMVSQCEERNCLERLALPFHQGVVEGTLPLTMGGGIGQSRICMYLLNKAHIGEVQASLWPGEVRRECEANGIVLL